MKKKTFEYLNRWIGMEEELKRSKNYIDHLERKIKVVLEENKVNYTLFVLKYLFYY